MPEPTQLAARSFLPADGSHTCGCASTASSVCRDHAGPHDKPALAASRIEIPHLTPDANGGFTPALPSLASRKISLRSKASKRGALITFFGQRRAVVFESHLELMTALMLLRLPGIVDLIDQPPAVTFVDLDGVMHEHTFDYLVVFADGQKWAVAVKPDKKASRLNLNLTLELIASQNASFADQFHLVTEKKFSRTQVSNARLMYHISYEQDVQVDAVIDDFVSSLLGTCTIGDMVIASGAGARAYRSVVRFLALGKLSLNSSGHIGYSSIVGKAA